MADIRLKVSTSVMQSKADKVSSSIKSIETQWKTIKSVIKASRSYWEGNASNKHQQLLDKGVTEKMDKLLRRLEKYPDDLLKMAGVYTKAENTAKGNSQKLPEDVIK